MQRAIISIGVKKTGELPELQAAQESATAFAEWARRHQKIPASRVKLITDTKSRVTRTRIFDAVEAITKLGFVEQLIVYFSGHGINVGLVEQWLLSRAPDDPVEAVNLRGSETLARFSGIGHVIFISDACRTAADSIQAQGVTGGEIFPNPKSRGTENPVDQFFATLVGNPSYEVKVVEEAVKRYRAAYSTVMLEALRGTVPALVEQASDRRLVRPRPLKKHLALAVPQYMNSLALSGGETQQPDARIESDGDAWIAEISAVAPAAPPAAPPSAPQAAPAPPPSAPPRVPKRARPSSTPRHSLPSLSGDEVLPPPGVIIAARRPSDLASEASVDLLAALVPSETATRKRAASRGFDSGRPRAPDAARAVLDRAISKGAASFGPDHFETQCGIKVRGTRVAEAFARSANVAIGSRKDVVQVDLHGPRHGANVAVQLADGSSVMVPVLRGYISGLTFDDEGNLDDVTCEPSANTPRGQDWKRLAHEITQLRAVIAAASSLGVFRLEDPSHAATLVQRMRQVKSADPAMAVYAAYAFHDRRMRSQIVDMQRYLDRDLQARIFDVAMLALTLTEKPAANDPRETYPCVPMLTQGWALLAAFGVTLPGKLSDLRGRLRPSLWTHFAVGAFGLLVQTLRDGKVE
jgi:hypothetical protein